MASDTVNKAVVEAKLADEFFPEEAEQEEGAISSSLTTCTESMVAGGKHSVPPGVAVEELKNYRGAKQQLKDKCPPDVHALMNSKPGL